MLVRTRTVLLLLLLASLGSVARAEVHTGDRAPDFDKATLKPGHLKLSALRGKVVLVDFWASWCEPCKRELPLLGKIAPKLRAQGIEIVTINIDDDAGKAERFLSDNALGSLTVVRDADKAIVGAWEPPKMPSSYVVDKGGVVRAVNAGFEGGDEVRIEKQLVALTGK